MIKKYKQGFTFIEISVTAFLLIILGVGILGIQRIILDSQVIGFANYGNVDEANSVLTQLSREIRTMRSGQNGAFAFIYGDSDEISFYSDIDFDGESELVRYYLTGTTLYKSVIEPVGFPATYPANEARVKPLTTNVVATGEPIFLYFNEDWPSDTQNNPLPAPPNIADVGMIRISLSINTNPNLPRSVYSLNTNVHIRMLKENL